jgi:hypothetical protein
MPGRHHADSSAVRSPGDGDHRDGPGGDRRPDARHLNAGNITCSELDYLFERARQHVDLVAERRDVAAGIDYLIRIAQEYVQARQRKTEISLGLPINGQYQVAMGIYQAWLDCSREGRHAAW